MKGEQIFEKMSELKEKFRDFFQQRKQMTALENHSCVQHFNSAEQEVFEVIKYCMKGSFLQDEDAEWISRKLNRLQINYLDWAHKTKWLKEQIETGKEKRKPVTAQSVFDFIAAQKLPVQVPTELLTSQNNSRMSARV